MKKVYSSLLKMLLAIAVIVICTDLAQAVTINVPTLAYPTVQAGINAAAAGDTVLVDSGVYTENIDFLGKAITVKSVNGAANTVIDGNKLDSVVIFRTNEKENSFLSWFTVRNGLSANGGGILCQSASPVIVDCNIINNTAVAYGGGIFCNDLASPVITNCFIDGNAADMGGGIKCTGASPVVRNCIISNNSSAQGGGGICFVDSSSIITYCTIVSNMAVKGGGGICLDNSSPKITKSTIRGNKAFESGGGITCTNLAAPEITACIISNNTADKSGGGINCNATSPTVANCVITGNTANFVGGGINCRSASPTVTNCTFADNNVGIGGGGIASVDTSASPNVKNSIFENNTAAGTLNEILVAQNNSITISYSDINPAYVLGTGTLILNHNINEFPQFIGGGDYGLLSGSPCIDTGISSGAPTDDLDGNNRPQPGTIGGIARHDMGAYEYATQPTVLITTDKPSYKTGDTLSASPQALAGNVATTADVYIRVVLPDGSILYLDALDSTSAPIAANWTVADWGPQVYFTYTFDGTEPSGNYTFEIYLTEPGTSTVIGRINDAAFTFTP